MHVVKGEKLDTKELIKRIGIGEATWKRNKNDILLALANVCEYQTSYSRK